MIKTAQKIIRNHLQSNDDDDDDDDDEHEKMICSVSFSICFLGPFFCFWSIAYDMLFFDLEALFCLSWFYNLILLETFGFETVLYCPLTHRYLCACCFGGQGNGDKTNL